MATLTTMRTGSTQRRRRFGAGAAGLGHLDGGRPTESEARCSEPGRGRGCGDGCPGPRRPPILGRSTTAPSLRTPARRDRAVTVSAGLRAGLCTERGRTGHDGGWSGRPSARPGGGGAWPRWQVAASGVGRCGSCVGVVRWRWRSLGPWWPAAPRTDRRGVRHSSDDGATDDVAAAALARASETTSAVESGRMPGELRR